MLSLASFGGSCYSGSHYLHQKKEAICTSGCARTNREALLDHLDEVTNFSTLWEKNSGGGWICAKGNLVQPRVQMCCCRQKRSEALNDLLFSLAPLLSKKIKRDLRSQVQPLDLRYVLPALCRPFEDHLSSLLFDTIGMARDSKEEAL